MSLRNQVLVWVGFTAVVIFAIWLLRPILLPFVLGIAIAYILNPVVNQVQRVRVNRGWATAIVLLAVLALISGIFLMLVPLIVQQIGGLVLQLPGLISDLQELIRKTAPQLIAWLGAERAAQFEASLSQMLGSGVEFVVGLASQIAQSGLTVLNTLAILIITPVVAFYLLLDWDAMGKGIDNLIPREHRREVRGVLEQIDRSMAGVIRGQGSVILVLCVYYSMALSFTGLSFGLVIGLLTGLLSFIPIVGFLTGFTVSLAIATVQFWPNGWLVLSIVAVYGIGQFLEGNVLYPKLVGQSININPVWLMFALFTFAYLFGFVGLLLAVPLAAITAVLTRYAVARYRQSTLYQGVDRSLRQPVPGVVARPTPEEAIIAAVEAEAEAVAPEEPPKPRARKARAAASK